jgi:ElaA protein
MEILVRKWKEMDIDLLYDAMRVRQVVFVVEQDCAFLDLDGLDRECIHVMVRKDGEIAAYARILPFEADGSRSIGRILTSGSFRGKGYGRILMEEALKAAGQGRIRIGAQVQAMGFYSSLGFKRTDAEEYLEDGIPHVKMILEERLK